jgi:hypothetical protein
MSILDPVATQNILSAIGTTPYDTAALAVRAVAVRTLPAQGIPYI